MILLAATVASALLNPAVSQATISTTICVAGWTNKIRPPASYTSKIKRRQLPKDARLRDYEEDHFMPLALGGAPRSPENLWPQPWRGPCGALAKDRDETRLHRAVCRGTMTLYTARREIVTKWKACRGQL